MLYTTRSFELLIKLFDCLKFGKILFDSLSNNLNFQIIKYLITSLASILRRLKKQKESGSIKDARAVVVLRTGNTGFPNVVPCLFIGKDVRLSYWKRCGTMFISSI